MSAHLNKVVIVTGASSGIGAAIAQKFSAEGAKVVLVARNELKLRQVEAKCQELGVIVSPLPLIADVSKDDDNKRVMEETIKKFGKLDVLINNAATPGSKTGVLMDNCMDMYEKVLATNIRGPVKLSNLAAPYLVQSKGNIVNISSVASIRPMGINFPYSISKAGLDIFTKCVAYELGPKGVRVNSVVPGPVRTSIFENMGKKDLEDSMFESLRMTTALERVSEPEEVADLVSYVASDKARSITGSLFFIECGTLLKGLTK